MLDPMFQALRIPPDAPVRRVGQIFLGLSLLAIGFLPAPAQHSEVASTVHNLSVTGPGEIRSVEETQVCKFCHVPHSAVEPVPLWGHALSSVPAYEVPELREGAAGTFPAPQPDGSSRLCLSCHDGTVALGDVAGEARPIPMAGAQRLGPGRAGFLGTDLSGSHPISFVVPDGDSEVGLTDSDMSLAPIDQIRSDGDVRLDENGKMQCTTCHDPHSDQFYVEGKVPRFWVKPSVTEVCVTCHDLR